MSDLQERTFGYRSRRRMGCRRTPRWHVRRLAHTRHVRATETRRALNRSARDSDTRGFHGLSNGSRLCWLLLLQESTSHDTSRCTSVPALLRPLLRLRSLAPRARAPHCRRRFLLILCEVGDEKISRVSVLIPPSSFENLLREKGKNLDNFATFVM